jgi:CubicO group peptidase (beta-lactamase class C family)
MQDRDRKADSFGVELTAQFTYLWRNFLTLVTFFFLASVCSSGAEDLNLKVAEYMKAQVEVNHFRGSILIAQDGRVLASKQYGSPDKVTDGESGSDNRYRIGSIAKQFTAAAILQLQEKGGLNLQDSICKYIAKCPSGWEQVKIFDLLTQTDGIPEVSYSPDSETTRTIPTPELLADLEARPLEFKPGEKLRYGNSGYGILGAVIEKVSGEPYLRYLKDHIFIPLEMHETGYDGARQMLPDADRGPIGRFDSITPNDLQMAIPYSYGRLYSTVEDLYRWDRALYGEELLSKESRAAMFTPYIDGYGFGWAAFKEFGRRVNTNAGGIDLFESTIRDYPDDRVCVIVLSSLDNADGGRISRDLAAMLFNKEYALAEKRSSVDMNPTLYAAYEGRYQVTPDFILMVRKNVNHLTIQAPGQAKVEIFPMSETRFFAKGLDTVVNFVTNSQRKATELVLQQGGRDIPAPRIQ